jgi:hypothetical protein
MNTYNKSCQIAASKRRLEDAKALHSQKRWLGSIYLGGYAVECSLKSFICYEEDKDNFKQTTAFRQGLRGSELHKLTKLLNCLPRVKRIISTDRTKVYTIAWSKVSTLWRNAELRYSEELGNEKDSEDFIEAAEKLHKLFLQQQSIK